MLGDIRFSIDGEPLDFAQTVGWRGAMFSGVPNMAWVFGYFRASWTLRADLLSAFVCRLLQHMDARGASVVTPTLRAMDEGMALKPWVEPENFNPGYIQRGIHLLPRQGEPCALAAPAGLCAGQGGPAAGRPGGWLAGVPLMAHLLASVSAHGLGHLAQSAPVLNALRRQRPGLRLTVASTLPEARLRQRIEGEFRIEPRALDIGFLMHDAFRVDLDASAAAYRELHADWDARVADAAHWLAELQPDLLLCNAAYLPLAAAARLGLPAFGMSSLNWADLFAHLYAGEPWARPIHAQMLQAYQAATAFIKLTPGMDMPDLPRSVWAGPVASLGRPQRDALHAWLQAGDDERIVLIAFGGIDARLPLERWRFDAGLRWLVPAAWGIRHARVAAIEDFGRQLSATCWPRWMR